jgi:hypothetical protein
MSIVPQYRGNQVQSQALPGVRINQDAPIEAFGGGKANQAAGAVRELGGVVEQIAVEEKKKADQLAVLDADQKLSALETRLLHDPQNGALNKRGKDAFGLPDTVLPEFQKQAEEIGKGLSGDSQKLAFQQRLVQRQGFIDSTVQRHVSEQVQKFDDTTTESYLANERDAAITNFQDPSRVQISLENQRAAVVQYAERHGMPEEYVKQKTLDAASKTHAAIVSRYLDGNLPNGDMKAKEYFDANKDQLSGADRTHLEKALEAGTLRGESQRQTDAIVGKAEDMGSALEQARKIQDPKIRDEVNTRVKEYYSAKKAAENERQENLHKDAADTIDKYGTVDKIPAEQWAEFSLSQRSALKSYAANRNKGLEPTTDWESYYNLKQLAVTPQFRDKFLQTNLYSDYRPKMADSEFKELVNLQQQMREGKGDKVLDGIRSNMEIVNTVANAGGIDTRAKEGTDEAQRLALYRSKVDEAVIRRQKQTGKPVTSEEVEQIANNLMVKVVTDRGFIWDTKKPVFELGAKETGELNSVDDVPRQDRHKIEEALQRAGKPVTDENVLYLYTRKLGTQVMNGR